MKSGVFHVPKLSSVDLGLFRSPGPGLGNLLFPIARALIGAARGGGVFVHPTIRQLKFGPILRGERDWRTYGNVLHHRTPAEWARATCSRMRRSISEADYDGADDTTVIYAGLRRQFHDLVCQREVIMDYLAHRAIGIESLGETYDLAIHVRRGDFSAGVVDRGQQSIQIRTEWYRNAFDLACETLGVTQPRVLLFTDGDPEAIRNELRLPHADIDTSDNALLSMLRMGQAEVLIGSRSTFSLWGNYLGADTAIWPMQFDLHAYKQVETGKDLFL